MSTVAIIGPGRLGTLLATASARAGHRLVAVAGGRPDARDRIAALVAGCRPVATPAEAARIAEVLVLAVPDDAIEQVVTDLALADAIGERHWIIHVAGSRGLDVLARATAAGARVAACHPAMTVPTGASDPAVLLGAAWAVTALPGDRAWAHGFVQDLGGDPHDLPDDRRALYHAGLAVASNAVAAAVAVARQLLLGARVDDPAAFLAPLVRASATNVVRDGASAITGPVVRGDLGTLAGHLAAIERDLPELSEAYRLLARATLLPVRAGMPPEAAAAIEALLVDGSPEASSDGSPEARP